MPANFINDIFQDAQGGLWIATNAGLGYFINNTFSKWSTKDGLPHDNCTVILPGINGEIWIGTNRGVAIFDGKNFTVITSREGLVFDLINRGAGYQDAQGNLWFGTGEGVSRFAVDYKLEASEPPPVHLLSVSNNGTELALNQKAQIKQGETSLLFDFTAISFQRAPDVQYRYRLLKKGQSNWRETRLKQLQIDSLSAGAYAFEVTARVGQGLWNTNTATFSFTITPPFWQTWWFILLSLTALFAALVFRNGRIKKHALYLEQMVSKRTKQLEELNQGLKWLANHDNLTRLTNRNYVQDTLAKISANGIDCQLGIIIIDLDYFKKINDEYGHTQGDKVLVEFAKILQSVVTDQQIAARWGGEEFLVVCPEINPTALQTLVEKIVSQCRQLCITVETQEQPICFSCSVGFAMTPKTQNILLWEKTIHLADMALYQAKHAGRDCGMGYFWHKDPTAQVNMNSIFSDPETGVTQGWLDQVVIKPEI